MSRGQVQVFRGGGMCKPHKIAPSLGSVNLVSGWPGERGAGVFSLEEPFPHENQEERLHRYSLEGFAMWNGKLSLQFRTGEKKAFVDCLLGRTPAGEKNPLAQGEDGKLRHWWLVPFHERQPGCNGRKQSRTTQSSPSH